MSESSRSRVTITLGRAGQVVKRDGSSFDNAHDHAPAHAGTKRSVRERLGNYVDSAEFSNKRMRGDGGAMIDTDDIRLNRDDLRYKIIQKTMRKQRHNRLEDGEDLRNLLSRPAQSSTNSVSAWEKLPEPKYSRPRYLEPKGSRQQILSPWDGRQLSPVTRTSSQHLPFSRVQQLLNPRVQQVPDARESGRIGLEPKDSRHSMPEISRSSMISDLHGPRTANNVSKMELGINSSSPWTLDHLRRRSPPEEAFMSSRGLPAHVRRRSPPEEALMSSRGLPAPVRRRSPPEEAFMSSRGLPPPVRRRSPPEEAFMSSRGLPAPVRRRSPPEEAFMSSRGLPVPARDEEPKRLYALRSLGDTRSSTFKDALELSGATSSSYLTKMSPPVGPMKTVAPIASTHPLPSSHTQHASYAVDDHTTIDIFLRSLGLEKFAIGFKAEEVDMYSLKRMTDSDLKELGIPMGPRKKILLALQPRLRRQA